DAAAYEKWLGGDDAVDMIARGKEVATKNGCFSCHTLDGQRHIGPTWARLYNSRVTLDNGSTVVADEAYLTRSMMEPLTDRVAGYNAVMPTYRGVLSAEEVGALVELIRSLEHAPELPTFSLPQLTVTAVDGGAR